MATENRFNTLMKSQPQRAEELLIRAQQAATARYEEYERRARPYDQPKADTPAEQEKIAEPA